MEWGTQLSTHVRGTLKVHVKVQVDDVRRDVGVASVKMVRIDHVDGGNGPALGGVVARAGGGGAVGGGALFVTTSSGRALFGGEGLDCVLGSNATAAIDTIDDCGALGGRGGGGGSEQVKREEKDQKMHCNGQIALGEAMGR